MDEARENEIDRNYVAFKAILNDILEEYCGKYALLKNQKIVSYHSTPGDAERTGSAKFKDGMYSVQLVSNEPIDLGFYSYAVAQGHA